MTKNFPSKISDLTPPKKGGVLIIQFQIIAKIVIPAVVMWPHHQCKLDTLVEYG
jgi:hypothetical protein